MLMHYILWEKMMEGCLLEEFFYILQCTSKYTIDGYINQRFYEHHTYIYTSSTAQGGGGSFKNRKPIGELGCCESRMAARSR